MGSRGWLLAGLGLLGVAAACGSDHDALARRSGTGGKTGQGGGLPGLGGFPTVANGGAALGSGGRKAPDEPPGATVLTFVHGVVDAERLLVCFVVGSGEDATAVGTPQPEAGLGYAESFVARPIDGIDYTADSIAPVVIAGEIELVAGLDCEAALRVAREEQAAGERTGSSGDGGNGAGGAGAAGTAGDGSGNGGAEGIASAGAGGAGQPPGGAGGTLASGGEGGEASLTAESSAEALAAAGASGAGGSVGVGPLPDPPRLRVGALSTIPAGSLTGGRSYLYVGNGCLGGPAFSHELERYACGADYAPRLATGGGVLVAMSRKVRFGAIGLQVVHASLATGEIEVTSTPTGMSTEPWRYLASGVKLGAIVPREPGFGLAAEDSGANNAFWQLEATQHSVRLFAEPWTSILRRAGIRELSNLETYAVVLVGPSATLRESGFWNPPAFALVPTDPEVPSAQ